jgi:hypothetical protein
MISTPPFLVVNQPGEEMIRWATGRLDKAGLRVVRTFDLRAARLSHPDCPCPHHGTQACDCQMIVLLVYAGAPSPVTMIIHSHQGTSWLYLVNTPQQPADQSLETTIQEALTHQQYQERAR